MSDVVTFLKITICFLLYRPFGPSIHDIMSSQIWSTSQHHISDFRKLEKVSIKTRKAELNLNFLRNCQSLAASFPSSSVFICQLQRTDRMLWPSGNDYYKAPSKRSKEFHKPWSSKGNNLLEHCSTILSTLDRYILQKLIAHNVSKTSAQFIEAHLQGNHPTNLSCHNLTPDQLEALKFGLTHSVYPTTISKTDIFVWATPMKRQLIDTPTIFLTLLTATYPHTDLPLQISRNTAFWGVSKGITT